MKQFILFIIGIYSLAILSGCSHVNAKYTFVSTKNIDYSQICLSKSSQEQAIGIHKVRLIIFIPTGGPLKSHIAVDNAINSVPGAIALADVEITYKWWYIPYFYGELWHEAKGTPLKPCSTLNTD